MNDPLHATEYARRLLVEELVYLCGADKLNLIQWRKELEEMSLAELGQMRTKLFDDLDVRYSYA